MFETSKLRYGQHLKPHGMCMILGGWGFSYAIFYTRFRLPFAILPLFFLFATLLIVEILPFFFFFAILLIFFVFTILFFGTMLLHRSRCVITYCVMTYCVDQDCFTAAQILMVFPPLFWAF